MTSRALLLGINKYKRVTSLRGCLNDLDSMKAILQEFYGFSNSDITILRDEQVVKKTVRKAMDALFTGLRKGDRVLLHFSGHGSFLPSQETGEDDKLDELICLHDMDFNDDGTFLRDKEMRDWTRKKPDGVTLVVVLDNCHSGSGTRLAIAPPTGRRGVASMTADVDMRSSQARNSGEFHAGNFTADDEFIVRNRFLTPPAFALEMAATARRATMRAAVQTKDLNHLLLAACRENQTAADAMIDGRFNGAFTFHLCKILRAKSGKIDIADLESSVSQAIQAAHFEQVPQIEGPILTGPFFAAVGAPSPPLVVKNDNSATATPPPSTKQLLDLFAQQNRLLELSLGRSAAPSRGLDGRFLVYVHGICKHVKGFSDPWWSALSPFAPSIQPGVLDRERREVVWSDLVNARAISRGVEEASVADSIRGELADRLQRGVEAAVDDATSPESRDAARLPVIDCIDDFAVYMTSDSVRQQIIDRFTSEVQPLLAAGATIDVISHSWGTVVAYEALCELESQSLPGRVRNWFTVGAALSVAVVKFRLRPGNRDGHRPGNVSNWVNLNASGDLVGGRIQGSPYAVDEEFVGLKPTGCFKLGPAVNPVCAHGSYFQADNLVVNRDIFGTRIA